MTEPPNRSVESYAHKAAKAAMVEWLRDLCADVQACEPRGVAGMAVWEPLTWRVDAPETPFGVFPEYPVSLDVGPTAWGTVLPDCAGRAPSRDDLIARGIHPHFILDVGIIHKGCITFGIEVVHRHPVSASKATLIERSGIKVLEIPAGWILRQVRRPWTLRYGRAFGPFAPGALDPRARLAA